MSIKKFLKFLLIITCITIFCVSCWLFQDETNTTNSFPAQEMYFPDEVLEFHINHQMGQKVFVLTEYQIPYHGSFQYIELKDSNEFELVNSYSKISSKGIVKGNITLSEKESLINSLNAINDSENSSQQGEYVLVLSYSTTDGVIVFSCQNETCPGAICSIYDLANSVIQRSDKKDYFNNIICPIDNK